MNKFATIENSKGFLKQNYEPKPVDLLEVLRRRRLGIKDQNG